MNISKQRKHQRGVGLLELMVAVSIMGTVGVSLLLALSTGVLGSHRVSDGRAALDAAQSQLEYIKAQDFNRGQWDSLDAVGGWNAEQGDETLSSDASDFKEGTGSLKMEGATSNNPGVNQTALGELDWSTKSELALWAKIDAGTADNYTLILQIHDSDGDYVYFDKTVPKGSWLLLSCA